MLVFTAATLSAAEPPWKKLVVFQRETKFEVDELRLSQSQGPWMILAVTFLGDDAEQQAHQLASELRSRFKLDAYTHPMQFDFSGKVDGRGIDQYGDTLKMRYQRAGNFREVAVLVGNFSTVDDPSGQKLLAKIKHMTPNSLNSEDTDEASDGRPLSGFRKMQQLVLADGNAKKQRGPMGHAFVTTNPLLPREYFVPDGLDPFLVELNKEVPHSLLACTGKYSVKVATFSGVVIHDQKKIKDIENGQHMDSKLEQAAMRAHRMTELLRAKGVEAYEFHDRNSSIVTVGSFNSVGSPRNDGKIEINPAIHKIIETYGAAKSVTKGQGGPTARLKEINKIPFDVQPIPIEVPRIGISNQYASGPNINR
jgi:hypothetical protein